MTHGHGDELRAYRLAITNVAACPMAGVAAYALTLLPGAGDGGGVIGRDPQPDVERDGGDSATMQSAVSDTSRPAWVFFALPAELFVMGCRLDRSNERSGEDPTYSDARAPSWAALV